MVDHADIYGDYRCEQLFGSALAIDPAIRNQLHIVTKCDIQLVSAANQVKINHYDTSANHIQQSVDRSLQRLGIEQIDTLLLHRPDLLMDPSEVAECFASLRNQGKVLNFGVSNFSASQFELLNAYCGGALVTNQLEINPLRFEALENGAVDQLLALKQRPMSWSCLAGGELFRPRTEQALRTVDCLRQLAQAYDTSIDVLSYAWVQRHPSRPITISGSGRIDRLAAALAAERLNLSREDWYRVWVASKGHGVP